MNGAARTPHRATRERTAVPPSPRASPRVAATFPPRRPSPPPPPVARSPRAPPHPGARHPGRLPAASTRSLGRAASFVPRRVRPSLSARGKQSMDIAEREAFSRARRRVEPAPRATLPDDAPARTPSDAGDWGPSPESRRFRDSRASARRSTTSTSPSVRRTTPRTPLRFAPTTSGPRTMPPGPAAAVPSATTPRPPRRTPPPGSCLTRSSGPGPRAGCATIHRSATPSASREPPSASAGAAELQQQMAERQRREQMEKSENRRADLATRVMERHPRHARRPTRRRRRKRASRSGTTTDRSSAPGRAPVPPGAADGPSRGPPASRRPRRGGDPDGSSSSPPPDSGRLAAAPRRGPLHPLRPGGGVVGGAGKAEHQRDLDAQVAVNAARKAMEKRVEAARDAAHERDAAGYNPWGKGGGGAPALGADGGRLVDLRDMRADFNERLEAGHPGNHNPGGPPVESFDAQFAGGIDRREREAHAMRAGHPTGGDPTGGASGAHRRGAPPVPPRVGFARAGARGNFRQREDAHPHELEAKERAREELQRALEAQIEEKRRRKEEEKLRLEREEPAEEHGRRRSRSPARRLGASARRSARRRSSASAGRRRRTRGRRTTGRRARGAPGSSRTRARRRPAAPRAARGRRTGIDPGSDGPPAGAPGPSRRRRISSTLTTPRVRPVPPAPHARGRASSTRSASSSRSTPS